VFASMTCWSLSQGDQMFLWKNLAQLIFVQLK
jgi:hypothetical protein